MLIAVRFLPPVQLGYGFTLQGIGGILGVNRTVAVDALRAGLRAGTLGSVLFPEDPIRNAPQIVSDLGLLFPPAPGRFLFGPLVQLGWGTPTLLTLELGLILELPAPVRLIILGRLRVLLPHERAPVVRLQLDALGVINFSSGDVALDATLYNSQVAQYAVSGDMALRASWGSDPGFLLAVGGFHPRFPAPAGFPLLERVAISLATGDNPRLRLEAYLALTSNTAQFGARLDLYASAGPFSVSGYLAFDTLLQFEPFSLAVEITAEVALKFEGRSVMSVGLWLSLTGPAPWYVQGEAHFTFLFVSRTVRFRARFGRPQPPPLPPPVRVWPLLLRALGEGANWRTGAPAGEHPLVSFREVVAPGGALVHPLAELAVSQRVVPLGREIARFGNTRPDGERLFSVGVVDAGGAARFPPEAGVQAVAEAFAPAQFRDLSDDEKLSAPAFESLPSGIRFAPQGYVCGPEVPDAATRYDRKTVLRRPVAAGGGLRGAAGRGPLPGAGRGLGGAARAAPDVEPDAVVIRARKGDVAPLSAVFVDRVAASGRPGRPARRDRDGEVQRPQAGLRAARAGLRRRRRAGGGRDRPRPARADRGLGAGRERRPHLRGGDRGPPAAPGGPSGGASDAARRALPRRPPHRAGGRRAVVTGGSPPAPYHFLPWVRSGAAATVTSPASVTASLPPRAPASVTLRVAGVRPGGAAVSEDLRVPLVLYGPGDVIGLDPRNVVRTVPRHLAPDFPPHRFAAVELDRPDLPWLFTPAGADSQGRLRPWIVLVVVRKEVAHLTSDPRRPLPVLDCPLAELPDLEDSWAWAHAQFAGALQTGEAVEAAVASRPQQAVSRLLCPRRLVGRLGGRPPATTPASSRPSPPGAGPGWASACCRRTRPRSPRPGRLRLRPAGGGCSSPSTTTGSSTPAPKGTSRPSPIACGCRRTRPSSPPAGWTSARPGAACPSTRGPRLRCSAPCARSRPRPRRRRHPCRATSAPASPASWRRPTGRRGPRPWFPRRRRPPPHLRAGPRRGRRRRARAPLRVWGRSLPCLAARPQPRPPLSRGGLPGGAGGAAGAGAARQQRLGAGGGGAAGQPVAAPEAAGPRGGRLRAPEPPAQTHRRVPAPDHGPRGRGPGPDARRAADAGRGRGRRRPAGVRPLGAVRRSRRGDGAPGGPPLGALPPRRPSPGGPGPPGRSGPGSLAGRRRGPWGHRGRAGGGGHLGRRGGGVRRPLAARGQRGDRARGKGRGRRRRRVAGCGLAGGRVSSGPGAGVRPPSSCSAWSRGPTSRRRRRAAWRRRRIRKGSGIDRTAWTRY